MKITYANLDFENATLTVQFRNAEDVLAAFNRVQADNAAEARAGNVINAIKRHRELTRLGLKESKDYIDNLRQKAGLF